jgi:photosystem II stability/assembly factor-like uncharacterized protein
MNEGLISNFARCFHSDGQNIFVGTEFGAFVSDNQGDKWIQINNGITSTYLTGPNIRSFASSGDYIFAGTDGGFFFTRNKGINWAPRNHFLPQFIDVNQIKILGTQLFVGSSMNGVFLSTNNGFNWIEKNNGLTPPFDLSVVFMINIESNLIIATGTGNFISKDSAKSWERFDLGFLDFITSFVQHGNKYFLGSGGRGIFISEDGGKSWAESSNGLINPIVTSLAIHDKYIFASTYGNGVFLSKDEGKNWIEINDGLSDQMIYTLIVHDKHLFAGSTTSGVWVRPVNEIVSTNESPVNNGINILPNPNSGSFVIEFPHSEKMNILKLQIMNSTGQIIFTKEIKNQTEWINLDIQPGFYFFQIADEKTSVFVSKVIIEN